MANEFIIKNGFHSKGDSQITGSLTGTSGTLNEFSSSYALTASHALSALASPGGNNQEVQFNNGGVLAGNPNFKIDNSTGIVSMISGAYFDSSNFGIIKYTPATEVLGINADDDSVYVEITGYDGGTKIRIGDDSANDGVQITSSLGGVNIKGSIEGTDQFTLPKLNVSASILNFTNNNYKINATDASSIIFNNDNRSVVTRIKGSDGLGSELQIGDKETLVSGSLHVKQFGITSSAGLLLNDSATTDVASTTNRILTPTFSTTGPGYPLLIQPGDSTSGTGGAGAHSYLQGGNTTGAGGSGGLGGNVYIIGGTSNNTSSNTGSIFLKGNKINLDNTALEYYSNASNFYKLLNYNSSDQCAEIGIVSYTATGGNARDVKFFADGEEAFKIAGGSGQKATLQGSRSGQHTEVRATSGSFSYLAGASPLVIDADNFSVSSTGEMSSGTGNGISTTSITASSNISASGFVSASSFSGDGSGLTNLPAGSTPTLAQVVTAGASATGDVSITGSLTISGSFNAFRLNTTDVILGEDAGALSTINGPRNVFVGYQAGYSNTIGDDNVAVGYQAGYGLHNNASDANVFIGKLAGGGGTSGAARMSDANSNIGLGTQALLYLTSGDQNIAIGSTAMRDVSSGGNNTALGAATLYNTDSGNNNIGIGYYAGLNQTSGDGNITIGSGSLGIAGESNQLRIGNADIVTISASLATGDIIFPSTASADYFVGDGSQLTNLPAASTPTLAQVVTAGASATGDVLITGSLTISGSFNAFTLDSDNIVLGSGSGVVMQESANNNVILGTNTADSLTTGDQNVAIGHQALQALTGNSGNTAIGFEAAKSYTNANSIFIGYRAGLNWSTGNDNVVIGKDAADAHTSGATNVYIGYSAAGGGVGGGSYNLAIGANSGKNLSTGTNNVALGKNAGLNLNQGTENIAIGTNALDSIAGGEYNIAIGYYAGASLDQDDGNIMIGFGSAADGTTNGELKIGSGSITTIYGDLATGDLTFPSTASADYFVGDGSQLTNLPAGSTPTLDAVTSAGNVTSNAITAGIISGSAFKLNNANALSHTGNVLYVGNANDWTTVELGRETTDEIHVNGILKAEQLLRAEQSAEITGSLLLSGSIGLTDGRNNVLLGEEAGKNLTTGTNSVMVGYGAGADSTLDTESNFVFIGYQAGSGSIAGYGASGGSVYIGSQAGAGSDTNPGIGFGNTAIGYQTGYKANIQYSTGIGYGVFSLVAGSGNEDVAIGYNAMNRVAGGSTQNVAIGNSSLKGYNESYVSNRNTAVGYFTGKQLVNSHDNVLLGWKAGEGLGTSAGPSNYGGNIFIGTLAGDNILTGYNNIHLGPGLSGNSADIGQVKIGSGSAILISGSITTGDIIFPSTASAEYFAGNGSQLTNLPSTNLASGVTGTLPVANGGTGVTSLDGVQLSDFDDDLSYVNLTTAQTVAGIKTFSSVVKLPNGTKSNPSIAFSTDIDLGIFKSATGILTIASSGQNVAHFNTNGVEVVEGALAVSSTSQAISPSTTQGRIDAANDIVAYSTSDKRLKENITPITNALDKIKEINGVEFDWKELTVEEKIHIHSNEGHDVGVIAQEIEKVLPEVVTTRDNGYKAVKYEKIVPLLIESIKELKAEIEELKKSK